MPIASYPVLCYRRGCTHNAVFKIAARWSDGVTQELKTYSLTCQDCLAFFYQDAWARHAACRQAPGEKLAVPGVYELVRGTRDRQLERRADLEETLSKSLVVTPEPTAALADDVEDRALTSK